MFDIGMSELLLIGIVALIVIGPKDLPALFHTLGRFTAKMRALGREFSKAMNDAARESGVNDVAGDLKKYSSPKSFGLDKLNQAADRFEKWDPKTSGATKSAARAPVDPERAADIEKIRAATEKAGNARLEREAAAKAAAAGETAKPAPVKAAATATAKTPAAKASPVKPAPAKKPAAKAKPAAKTASAAKPAGKTVAAKPAAKTAAAKPAAKKTAARKPATKTTPAAKKAEE